MPEGTEECLRELESLEVSSLSHGYDVTQAFYSHLQFSVIMNRKLSKHDLCSNCSYDFSNLLTHPTEQSPSWEANWSAASQEIPRILWNQKVHDTHI